MIIAANCRLAELGLPAAPAHALGRFRSVIQRLSAQRLPAPPGVPMRPAERVPARWILATVLSGVVADPCRRVLLPARVAWPVSLRSAIPFDPVARPSRNWVAVETESDITPSNVACRSVLSPTWHATTPGARGSNRVCV
ncbi:hypothetical protein K525DRAFT_189889 [Schizophyllum commune Loenen D]|nr:hypothetical protein K525DRAFT_189889 [Schizophyllum commune Loenen D]